MESLSFRDSLHLLWNEQESIQTYTQWCIELNADITEMSDSNISHLGAKLEINLIIVTFDFGTKVDIILHETTAVAW